MFLWCTDQRSISIQSDIRKSTPECSKFDDYIDTYSQTTGDTIYVPPGSREISETPLLSVKAPDGLHGGHAPRT